MLTVDLYVEGEYYATESVAPVDLQQFKKSMAERGYDVRET
jgi:hypothetical protein